MKLTKENYKKIKSMIGKNMIIKKLEESNKFTNSEKEIAKYIVNNLDEINKLSIEELAKKTFTSKASIIRLCKKVEVKGYIELQAKIDRELLELNKIKGLLDKEPIDKNTKYGEIISILPSLYEKVITGTKLSLDSGVMKKIIEKLKKSKKIELYGVGISETIAKMAAFKFMTLGIESEAYNGLNEHYIIASEKGRENVAILISLTGNNSYIVKIAKELKKREVFVIGIGEDGNSLLSRECNEYIAANSKNRILSLEVLFSIMSINYILDIFFTSLLIEKYEDNIKVAIEVLKNEESRN